jgi:hypothetical protein
MTAALRTAIRAALAIMVVSGQMVALPSPGRAASDSQVFYCCCTGECHCTGDCCNHGPEPTTDDDDRSPTVNSGTALPAWQGGQHCGVWQSALQTIPQPSKSALAAGRTASAAPAGSGRRLQGAAPGGRLDRWYLWSSPPRAPPFPPWA